MRTPILSRVVALVGLGVIAACGPESRTDAIPTSPAQTLAPVPAGGKPSLTVAPGTCITFAALTQAAYDAFGAGSPDANSVIADAKPTLASSALPGVEQYGGEARWESTHHTNKDE